MKIEAKKIKEWAQRLGFDACGMAPARPVDAIHIHWLDEWLKAGCEAGMSYMANHRDLRIDPSTLVEGARTVISVALNYYPPQCRDTSEPHIAYYAYGKDYHDVMKRKLRELWQMIRAYCPEESGAEARVFVDSAPLLERYWAWRCGLGWIGKNTSLILPHRGSFFFLGEIVMNREVDQYDEPIKSHCGTCERCLQACPTHALEYPHRLNAHRCISYLTIENREEIPAGIRRQIKNHLFGCDACQLACPHNRFSRPTRVEEFHPSEELLQLKRASLYTLTEEDYRRIFKGSAVKRAKFTGLQRTIQGWKKD